MPTDYSGDALEVLARLQAAAEGAEWPLRRKIIERLGAPLGADWSQYPTSDKWVMLPLGLICRWFGVGVAANAGLLLAYVASTLAFYGVARWLRVAPPWAMAGALLFAFTTGLQMRGLAHLALLWNWTLPLGLLACGWVAGRTNVSWRSGRGALCLLTALAFGASNPYNVYFWLPLLGWAVLVQALPERRRPENLKLGLILIGAAVASFVVSNAEVWLYPVDEGTGPLMERNYAGTEQYALKPIELIIPPAEHRWDALAFFGRRYLRWSEWRGEALMPYLGLVGAAALFGLLAWSTWRALRGRRLVPAALQTGWLLGFSLVGGLSNVAALFLGVQIFRATNRVSIWLAVIVLLFAARQLSRFTAHWRPAWRWAVAGVVVTIGLLDQLPRRDGERARTEVAQFAADREFGEGIERTFGAGALVAELPVFDFPEVPKQYELGNYEPLRLYLHTETARFAFGGLKGLSPGEWYREMAELPIAAVVGRLEEAGFAALVVQRRGFAEGGEELLEALGALGYAERLNHASGDMVAVRLSPVAKPVLPLAERFTLGQNWHRRPLLTDGQEVMWSFDDAVLNYYNPYSENRDVAVHLTLVGAGERQVQLKLNGALIGEYTLNDEPLVLPPLRLALRPGSNRLDLLSPQPAVRRDQQQYGLQSIGVVAMRVEGRDARAAAGAEGAES